MKAYTHKKSTLLSIWGFEFGIPNRYTSFKIALDTALKSSAFFPKSLLTVSLRQLIYLPKILYALQASWLFFVNFSISSFWFSLALLGSFDEALAILQVQLFVGFHHVTWSRLSMCGCLACCFCWCSISYFRFTFLFPATMVFVVFELFCEKLASSFAFCHTTCLPFTRTRIKEKEKKREQK